MKKKRNNLVLALFILGAVAFLAAWVYFAAQLAKLIWNSTLPDWLKVWLIK